MTAMTIGQLAARAGVPIDTVRYYERHRLVTPATRTVSGYRQYGEVELKRLRFVRRAKALGFTLADIRSLLALSNSRDVARIRRAAADKLGDIEQRIAELQRVRAGLERLVRACPGHGRAEACPILNALGAGELP